MLYDLSPQNEEKQYGRQIHPLSFESSPLLTNVEQTVKLKRILQKSQK